MLYTRRDLGKLALAAPFAGALKGAPMIDSVIDGIQFGAITYSFNRLSPDEIIQAFVAVGLGEVELMSNHCEAAAGAPAAGRGGFGGGGGRAAANAAPGAAPAPAMVATPAVTPAGAAPADAGAGRGQGRGGGRAPLTPEQQAAQAEAQKKLADWRASANAATWAAVRKKFNDAGIAIGILCANMGIATTDDMIDYNFAMAKGIGAKAISTSTTVEMSKRLAAFGEKHQMRIGYHCHDAVTDPNQVATPESFEAVFSYGKWNWANMDIGHYTAGGNDPVAFIAKYHDRITNLHVKDMKRMTPDNRREIYTQFGEGDTNMKGVMDLLRKGRYDFPANIEMEAPLVGPDGDAVAEMKKCFAYCKSLLA
jgi:sugar phosphate isomerase/epimerase